VLLDGEVPALGVVFQIRLHGLVQFGVVSLEKYRLGDCASLPGSPADLLDIVVELGWWLHMPNPGNGRDMNTHPEGAGREEEPDVASSVVLLHETQDALELLPGQEGVVEGKVRHQGGVAAKDFLDPHP